MHSFASAYGWQLVYIDALPVGDAEELSLAAYEMEDEARREAEAETRRAIRRR